jgi:hypothetical protein
VPASFANGTWSPEALDIAGRPELWVMLDDAAVAACVDEVGARIGTIAPAMAIGAVLAELPAAVTAVWIDPFDPEGGLVIDGDELVALRRTARAIALARGLVARGAATLADADEVLLAVIAGAAVTEPSAAGDRLVVFTTLAAVTAFQAHVPAGTAIAIVHVAGRDLGAHVRAVRATRPLVGVVVDPAGPSISGPHALSADW